MFQEEKTRFFLEEDGKLVAEIRWEYINDELIDVNGTFVDPSQRGKGLAKKLVLEVIEKVKKENLKIVPTCSYVVDFFNANPEYEDLLKK